MSIESNIHQLKKQLPATCTLVAVSKTQPIERLQEAYVAGQRIFGENKVQEMAPKYEALPKDIEWHMIGHLQSNKVKYIAPFVSLIHSVDSLKLLEEINRQGAKNSRVIPCLLQVHIAREETKFGFSEEEIINALDHDVLAALTNIKIIGLMGMATFTDNLDQVRAEFKGLKLLFESLKEKSSAENFIMQQLSMGMSGDYVVAIEEGSTMIRVGRGIFGNRNYNH